MQNHFPNALVHLLLKQARMTLQLKTQPNYRSSRRAEIVPALWGRTRNPGNLGCLPTDVRSSLQDSRAGSPDQEGWTGATMGETRLAEPGSRWREGEGRGGPWSSRPAALACHHPSGRGFGRLRSHLMPFWITLFPRLLQSPWSAEALLQASTGESWALYRKYQSRKRNSPSHRVKDAVFLFSSLAAYALLSVFLSPWFSEAAGKSNCWCKPA